MLNMLYMELKVINLGSVEIIFIFDVGIDLNFVFVDV